MFKKLLIATVASVALLGTAAFTSQAQAGTFVDIGIGLGRPSYYYPPVVVTPVVVPSPSYYPAPVVVYRHYEVLYRHCAGDPWRVYADYYSHVHAREAIDRLAFSGYEVRLVRH